MNSFLVGSLQISREKGVQVENALAGGRPSRTPEPLLHSGVSVTGEVMITRGDVKRSSSALLELSEVRDRVFAMPVGEQLDQVEHVETSRKRPRGRLGVSLATERIWSLLARHGSSGGW